MAAQPEKRDELKSHGRSQLALVTAARRADRRAVWVSAITAAGVFSVGAGAIHASATSYQMGVSALYGLTFVAFAVGQIGWGLLAAAVPSRPMAVVGAVGNAAVFATWSSRGSRAFLPDHLPGLPSRRGSPTRSPPRWRVSPSSRPWRRSRLGIAVHAAPTHERRS
jgi:hypothetical protein